MLAVKSDALDRDGAPLGDPISLATADGDYEPPWAAPTLNGYVAGWIMSEADGRVHVQAREVCTDR